FYDAAMGKAFSFEPDAVFFLGNSLVRRNMDNDNNIRLIPDTLICTDKSFLAASIAAQKLYFAANGDIYTVSFWGTQLQNLTPENADTLYHPALSSDNRYLTMIREGKINRLDLQTGERVEINNSPSAEYAVYRSDLDKYYFYSVYDNILTGVGLYRCDADGAGSTMIMRESGPYPTLGVSNNRRFYGLLSKPYVRVNDTNKLRIYDSANGTIREVEVCSAFAFSPTGADIYVSQKVYSATNIARINLETGEKQMLFDGILSSERYFYPIWEITPRVDGEYIYFRGFTYKYNSPYD
ncbi:MAG: hypothetical protein Q8J62_02800, partial [Candidatus Cloacimonadaceae bacterium]|nr:hypothetical protein [Candidatus Cloacimonadaceae bacterium]